jgi:membrane dipeptidase
MPEPADSSKELTKRALLLQARELLQDHVVLDCLFVPMPDKRQIDRLRAGGVTTVHTTVAIFEDFRGLTGRILDLQQVIDSHGGAVRVVGSVEEIRIARAAGQIGIMLGTQNTTPIEDDPRLVGLMRRLGIRVVQLTYNDRNLVGDGCAEPTDSGLSVFGRRVVAELNKERLLIDLSHVGNRTAREAIDASSAPVIISHSNARALCDHPRNVSDETIRAVAKRRGVIGVNGFPGFLLAEPRPKPTVNTLVDHIQHIASIAGPQHVGIGLDLDETDTPPEHYLTWDGQPGLGRHPFPPGFLPPWPWTYAIQSMADFMDIPEAMLERGFSENEVVGILGENFLRVFQDVWGE